MSVYQQRVIYQNANKNMEFKDLKNKDKKELQGLLLSNREKLRELRFKDSNKQLKNVREIRAIKVLIAQILTLLNKQK